MLTGKPPSTTAITGARPAAISPGTQPRKWRSSRHSSSTATIPVGWGSASARHNGPRTRDHLAGRTPAVGLRQGDRARPRRPQADRRAWPTRTRWRCARSQTEARRWLPAHASRRYGRPRPAPDMSSSGGRPCSSFGCARYASAQAACAPARSSLYVMESIRASKLASMMLEETPTVNQRSPVALSRLSTSTRVTASVPPVRMRTL